MFRAAIAALALLICSCGYNQSLMESKYRQMSDAELMRHHAFVNTGLTPAVNPQYKWTTDEMKRRGLLGPGKDGRP